MKNFYLVAILIFPLITVAAGDTSNVPLSRQVFHDKIKAEQKRADKADGKLDGIIRVSNIDDVNLQVTDAIGRKINVLRNDIENNTVLATNNDKIRYLRFVESLLKNFNSNWRANKFSPALAPVLVDNFSAMMKANIRGESIASLTEEVPYEAGIINTEIFKENSGYEESKKILFLKFCQLYPDKILSNIGSYAN